MGYRSDLNPMSLIGGEVSLFFCIFIKEGIMYRSKTRVKSSN